MKMPPNVLTLFLKVKRPVTLSGVRRCYSSNVKSVLSLRDRGMFKDIFPGIAATEVDHLLKSSSQCVYAGFDPTADSLHVGNLLVLINLLHWQRCGHQVIALVGGATGHIGDPSERSTDRPYLSSEKVFQNVIGIKNNIETVFENHRRHFSNGIELLPVKVVNNYDWYRKMNSVEFVGYVGRHFRIGPMLGRDSVSQRLNSERGMSFTEFSYSIFQAYDWLHLFRESNCRFQIGGSDQMGNIVSGHDLVSRVEKKTVYGITLPLIKSETGDKFGKSAGNAVWLSPEKTSSYDLYQFFVRTTDADVEHLLKLFTFHRLDHIRDVMLEHKKDPSKWIAQKVLADDVTTLVHGEEGLRTAKLASSLLHDSDLQKLQELSSDDALQVFHGAPVKQLILEAGMTFCDVSMKAGCFPSESDARRIIKAGGFTVNYQKTKNPDEIFSVSHILPNKFSLLRVGKKNFFLVRWV